MKKSFEDTVAQDLADQMSKSIDFELLRDHLVGARGWTQVQIKYSPPERKWNEIIDWADRHCQGRYQEHLGIWLFENRKDAVWFALRWQ